ncbi:cysteine--tRNA ligase [archaeon]|jgi:cysteinyl-tRNA synthetase|nr:cysteine--tRNA ligase [archaeon]
MDMLRLYNTLSHEKEEFKPIKEGKVGLYTCGPTVYWYGHVGNMRSYVFADILKRVLMYNGLDVKHVINVTDVGHLTSDADSGDDKMEAAASKEGKTANEISHFYFDAFRDDFHKLNLIEPFKWTWATEHIKDQISMIGILEKKGYTYKTSDGIYFDTSKFADYGKLSRKKIDGLEEGKRVEMGEKKNKTDFALWKFSGTPGERQQEWDSPWGLGFPGWHIECSAMSSKYLGKQFDLHTGGEDNMPIHHENEIAQSECAWGKKPWVKTWMHGAFLNIKGGKMSKSEGKIQTISELEKDGISPLAYRYFTFSAKYRKPLVWSEEAIASAVSSYKRLRNVIAGIENRAGVNKKYLKEFEARINDDLDMPGALAVLWKLVRDEKAEGKIGTIKKMDQIFGLRLLETEEVVVPEDVIVIAEEREKARADKDWAKSDELRDEIAAKGWSVKDGKNGFELEKI